MQPHQLVGTWKLLSYEFRFSDGSVSYPWGRDAEGLAIYSADGYVMATACSANRPRFASDDLAQADPHESAQAARTYVSYGGSYELHGNKVIHHDLVSLFPNWVGQPQIRLIEQLEADHLTLATEPATFVGQSVQGFFTGNALKKQSDKGKSVAERRSFESRGVVNVPVPPHGARAIDAFCGSSSLQPWSRSRERSCPPLARL